MKTTFTPTEIFANCGCYSREQVEQLSFISKSEISLIEIMQSEISIKDKRWFLFNKGELSIEQKRELAFLMAKSVAEIFNNKYPNDNCINECLQAVQDFNEGKIDYAADAADAAYAAYAAADAADAAAQNHIYSKKLEQIIVSFIIQNEN